MPYLCPECERLFPTWAFLRGHLVKTHKAEDYKDKPKEDFQDYAISDEEAKERKRAKVLGEAGALKELPTDPIERLDAVLKANRVDLEVAETVVNIFRLNPRWWGDPYMLDDLLRPRVKPQGIVVSLVKQYIDGVDIPKEMAERYNIPRRQVDAYSPGGEGGRGGGEYPGYPRGRGSEPVTQADLLAEREHQRQERDQQETQRRITALETRSSPLLEDQPETKTMTIADEHGNPMVIPFDPMLMAAIRREQEAKARKAEREEMLSQMTALSGSRQDQGDIKGLLDAALKPLQDEVKEAKAESARTREDLRQQQMAAFEGRVQRAEEAAEEAKAIAASASRGDKSLADYLEGAGSEAKDAVTKVVKDIKEGFQGVGDQVTSVITGGTFTRKVTVKNPADVAAIMEAEDQVMRSLSEMGKVG